MHYRYVLTLLLYFIFSTWILIHPWATKLGNETGSVKNNHSLIIGFDVSKSTSKIRSKRDVWQLYSVITCMTPCDPLILKDYGCYCGLGGMGYPVDAIDRCCMVHDHCYDSTPCHPALTYFLPYNWKCVAGRPYCSLPVRWSPAYTCAVRLCECDRLFSECLNAYSCPKHKAICTTSQLRHMWQKFLIKLGIG